MKKFLMMIPLLFSLSACSAMSSVLPVLVDIVTAVQDAQTILDTIDANVTALSKAGNIPDDVLKKYAQTMEKARAGLRIALRATSGAQSLSQQQVDQAFADFRGAYKELVDLLKSVGLVGTDGTMRVSPEGAQMQLPEPLALNIRVRK